jgi:hypothetical protein
MILVGHIARIWAKRNEYRILVEKPEGKRPLGRRGRWWVDLRKAEWNVMDWIDLAQDSDQWRDLVDTVKNLRVS